MKDFVKQYKEYAEAEKKICKFYRNIVGDCTQCPLQDFSCGTFDFDIVPIENLVEVLEKWRNENETHSKYQF